MNTLYVSTIGQVENWPILEIKNNEIQDGFSCKTTIRTDRVVKGLFLIGMLYLTYNQRIFTMNPNPEITLEKCITVFFLGVSCFAFLRNLRQ